MNRQIDSMLVAGNPAHVSKVYFDFVKTFWMRSNNTGKGGELPTELTETELVGEAKYKRSLRQQFPVKSFAEKVDGENIIYMLEAGGNNNNTYHSTITFSPVEGGRTRIIWDAETSSAQVPFTAPLLQWLMADKVFMPMLQHLSNVQESERQKANL